MSTEVFPLTPLQDVYVRNAIASAVDWDLSDVATTPHCGSSATLRLKDIGAVRIYFGNGAHRFDRGYRPDAVWFEAFGMGGPRHYTGPFFKALGALLGCEFVTELGQKLDEEEGIDSDDWGDGELGWHPVAISAMEREPGSTGGTKIYDKPKPFVDLGPST